MSVGYSGTPLPAKLGIAESAQVATIAAPPEYRTLLGRVAAGVKVSTSPSKHTDIVHLLATDREDLGAHLTGLRRTLNDEAVVWVSWPKKASKVATTVTEDVIRELALPLGFVDVKVCAVSNVWSGLKLVVRKNLRKRGTR
ncbi:MAG: DUF3052 family protein [Gemmatimonadales bacterium]